MDTTLSSAANGENVASSSSQVPVRIFALATAILVTNLFATQALVRPMAASLHIPIASAGFLPMFTLLGYASGLLLLVPLADLFENRNLILCLLIVVAAAAVGVVVSPHLILVFACLFVLGAGCSAVQVLIPLAAALTEPERRGQVLGDIMGGLLIGLLLSRPIASLLAGTWDWKAFYMFSAVSTTFLLFTLVFKLPSRVPVKTKNYPELIASLWQLFAKEKILRDRSISAAIVMSAFNLFWTGITFVLASAPLHFNQIGIAIFALVGAGGAFITPIIGRLADQGIGHRITTISHILIVVGFILAAVSGSVTSLPPWLMIAGLAFSALLMEAGVLGDQTVGRYMINLLNPEARGRINGIFVGVFFLGGSVGSALSGLLWIQGGWTALSVTGALIGATAMAYRLASRQ